MKKALVCVSISAFIMLIVAFLPVIEANPEYSLSGRGEVLVQGAPFRGANGLYFDSNDRLYIASAFGNEIVVMDPDSGTILERISGTPYPDDLTFGPDGSLYYTSIGTGYVYRIKPNGNITSQRVSMGVNPITFSSTGRLFVALDFYGDGLYELDPELVTAPKKLNGNASLGYLNGMDFGPDGLLYGPIWTQGRVVKINVDAAPFAMTTVCDEEIGVPAAVKFDSKGSLYVLDAMKGEVARINVTSGHKTVVATGFASLDNLAFDSQDRLFVSGSADGSISEVLPSGEKRLVSKGGMSQPGGVAVVPDSAGGESVIVADLWGIQEYDGLTGNAKSAVYSGLAVSDTIVAPRTVSFDGENLILTSSMSSGVQLWNLETGNGTMVSTRSAVNAIRFGGQIVISQNTGVIRASDNSSIADVPGATGLAAIGDDLYVAEKNSGTVWRIVSDGVPTKVQVATGLSLPEGLAVDLNGDLLVVESGAGRVSRMNPVTGNVSVVVEGLELGGSAFSGVAVGSTGYIYVTGDKTNVLYRLYPAQLPAGASSWPMFHNDLQHTGCSASPAPNTNQTLWTYTTGNYTASAPAVVGGRVYVGSWDKRIYCLDAATGAQIWNFTTGDMVDSSPAVADGRVYVGSYDNKIYCLDASTGAHIWNYTTGNDVPASPAVADGKVYASSWDQKIYCLNAATGAHIWNYTTGNKVGSSPAVVNGKVYVGSDDGNVYCLNAFSGALVWNYTTGGAVESPAVADSKVYVGSLDKGVYCLDAATGVKIWNYTTSGGMQSSPAVANGKVYIGSLDKKIYCLNAATGAHMWNYTTGGSIVYSSPIVADGKVYIGSNDLKVWCLNAADGAFIWSYRSGGAMGYSSLAVANGVVYIGSLDRKVYAFSVAAIPEFSPAAMILLFAILAAFAVFANKKQRRTNRFFNSQ